MRPGKPGAARGFTLLEVMISLAILAVALVAISGTNGGAVAMHGYARQSTKATLLLRGKMLDLEELLTKEGFHDFDDEKSGTFEEEAAPEYAWKAQILKPDIQLDPQQLLGLAGLSDGKDDKGSAAPKPSGAGGLGGITGALDALGKGAGGPGGAQALAGGGGIAGGLLQNQATQFIELLKKSVREVRLTVSWKDGSRERSITASQQIVILPEMVGKAGVTPAAPRIPPGTQDVPPPPTIPVHQ